MKLRIEHTTTFTYQESISERYTEMRLRPLDGSGQRCWRFKLFTEPTGEVMQGFASKVTVGPGQYRNAVASGRRGVSITE